MPSSPVLLHIYCPYFSTFWHCHPYILQHFNGNVFYTCFTDFLFCKYNAVYTRASPTPFVDWKKEILRDAKIGPKTKQCNILYSTMPNSPKTVIFPQKTASGGTGTRDILRTRHMLYQLSYQSSLLGPNHT